MSNDGVHGIFERASADRGMEMHACNCLGPRNGQPLCPCQMRGVRVIDGRYVKITDLGPASPRTKLAESGWADLMRAVNSRAPAAEVAADVQRRLDNGQTVESAELERRDRAFGASHALADGIRDHYIASSRAAQQVAEIKAMGQPGWGTGT